VEIEDDINCKCKLAIKFNSHTSVLHHVMSSKRFELKGFFHWVKNHGIGVCECTTLPLHYSAMVLYPPIIVPRLCGTNNCLHTSPDRLNFYSNFNSKSWFTSLQGSFANLWILCASAGTMRFLSRLIGTWCWGGQVVRLYFGVLWAHHLEVTIGMANLASWWSCS